MTAPLHALTDALRTAIQLARRSDAPAEVYDEARDLIDRASRLLEPHRYGGEVQQAALRGIDTLPGRGSDVSDPAAYFPYSPIVGPLNAIAPPVRMKLVGERMTGEVTVPAQYAGPPGMVHGGVIALFFDELLGATNVSNGYGGFTGTLTIRYERKTPIDAPLSMEGWIERVEGRKVFTHGEIYHDGQVTARAHGVFILAAGTSPGS